jgi:Na+-transporting NADH:ubiquinone oxidoreductase subunit F
VKKIAMSFFNLSNYPRYFKHILLHAIGRMAAEEKVYIPESEFKKIFLKARIYLTIYSAVIAMSIYERSLLPLMFIGFTNLFGTWLLVVYGLTQHAGLAENVLDHRLNCRTVYMNPVHRFLYWNMNYHIEHHMFPLVPYHALPRLHEVVKDDCPTPYPSLLSAWREIISAIRRQVNDPAYHVKRRLPEPQVRLSEDALANSERADSEGWVDAGDSASLGLADVVRFGGLNRSTHLRLLENSRYRPTRIAIGTRGPQFLRHRRRSQSQRRRCDWHKSCVSQRRSQTRGFHALERRRQNLG